MRPFSSLLSHLSSAGCGNAVNDRSVADDLQAIPGIDQQEKMHVATSPTLRACGPWVDTRDCCRALDDLGMPQMSSPAAGTPMSGFMGMHAPQATFPTPDGQHPLRLDALHSLNGRQPASFRCIQAPSSVPSRAPFT